MVETNNECSMIKLHGFCISANDSLSGDRKMSPHELDKSMDAVFVKSTRFHKEGHIAKSRDAVFVKSTRFHAIAIFLFIVSLLVKCNSSTVENYYLSRTGLSLKSEKYLLGFQNENQENFLSANKRQWSSKSLSICCA